MPGTQALLPTEYAWLKGERGPEILMEALRWYGTLEMPGDASNPVIIEWAKEVGGWIGTWYTQDSVPWCGLLMAMCAKRAGYPFTQKALSALEWSKFGLPVAIPAEGPMLGDVLTFKREGGGHVALYVGEDAEAYHVLGGNQHDAVCITRIAKARLYAARRCAWHNIQPSNVRKIVLAASGHLSDNEG